MRAGSSWTETDLVFTTKRGGGYIHPANVSQSLRCDLAKAGLPRMRFHDHTSGIL